MLSDSDSDTNDLHTITINEHFAKAFEYKKEREELAKLEEKYGSDYSGASTDDDDSEDSEDTDEDSDGEELTPAVDAAILRTLALIRKKDPAIYEGGRRVFDEEHTRTEDKAPVVKPKTKEKSKPLTVREAALASALAEADLYSRSQSPESQPLTHTEEQALLRVETRAAFHSAIDSEPQGDDDDLLVPRSRTRDEIELEEEEYKAFLEREVGEDIRSLIAVDASNDAESTEDGDERHVRKKRKKGKRERDKEREETQEEDIVQGKAEKQHAKKSKDEVDREFLMNYIFNRGWIDRSNRRVPTYGEIVGSSSKRSKWRRAGSSVDPDSDDSVHKHSDAQQGATLSDENSFDDLADAFETSYNFRFEEPGGALITSFPRSLVSARRESTTRKDARARKKERQKAEERALLEARRDEIRRERVLVEAAVDGEDEGTSTIEKDIIKKISKKQQRKEELARLKALKANELRRRLEKVSSEGGLDGIGGEALAHLDLDADWDPSRHDAQMAELYGGDEDIVDDGDAKKPVWDDDINIDDIVPPMNTISKAEKKKQRKKEKKKSKNADEGVAVDVDEMDADAGWGGWNEDNDEWEGTEDAQKRKVDAYMDEVVNKLGFSGITAHMPTRFHYTTIAPEDYGLTSVEILLATDAELNSYVGLKKLAPYRVDRGGRGGKNWDPNRVQRLREFRESLRSRVGSRYGDSWSLAASTNRKSGTTDKPEEKQKRKGKKERAKLRAMQGDRDGEGDIGSDLEAAAEPRGRKHDPNVGPHSPKPPPGKAEADREDVTQQKRRRRRHKKGPKETVATVAS